VKVRASPIGQCPTKPCPSVIDTLSTLGGWLGGQRLSPEAAQKKVEEARAELQNALLAGASSAELARLRTALAAAQLAESYALSGGPQAPRD